MERQSPAFLYLVTVQMVNCIRDKEGKVVQGKRMRLNKCIITWLYNKNMMMNSISCVGKSLKCSW